MKTDDPNHFTALQIPQKNCEKALIYQHCDFQVGANTVNVIKSNVNPVDVLTTSTTATVLTTGTTVAVYAPTGTASNVTVLREAPDGTSENSLIKVVECPTTDGCPASE